MMCKVMYEKKKHHPRRLKTRKKKKIVVHIPFYVHKFRLIFVKLTKFEFLF